MRYLIIPLIALTLVACTHQQRTMLGGTAIVVGGLGALSAAQVANSNPDCLNCEGDTQNGLKLLGGGAVLALIGVAIIAIDVGLSDKKPDEVEKTDIAIPSAASYTNRAGGGYVMEFDGPSS